MYAKQRRYSSSPANTDRTARAMHVQLHSVLQVSNMQRALPPQSAIDDVVQDIANSALCEFLDKVLHEPMIHGLITLPLIQEGQPTQFPIQIIRRTASAFSAAYHRTRQEKDLLMAATVLWALRSLLPLSIHGDGDLQDVFFTVIRSALHILDERTYEVSMVLRGLIGLGDETEEQWGFIAAMQGRIQRVVQDMHRSKPWLLPSMQGAIDCKTELGVRRFAQQAFQ